MPLEYIREYGYETAGAFPQISLSQCYQRTFIRWNKQDEQTNDSKPNQASEH